ncbi:MAG: hypothetical protein KKA79_00875 [Nanoarchaeota archaeon]|nr:hypothetical protein [Nanoarchaeota archaeon]
MLSEKESKVVFRDGEETRAIRGIIINEDSFFITIQRRDGFLRLNKSQILKIEEWNNNNKVGSDEHEQI